MSDEIASDCEPDDDIPIIVIYPLQEAPVTVEDIPSAAEDPFFSSNALTTPFAAAQSGIAKKIIWIFGLTLVGSLVLNFFVVVMLLLKYRCQADQIGEIVSKGIVPLLTSTGTFASTLFGPLLAFILGYYFRQQGQTTPED